MSRCPAGPPYSAIYAGSNGALWRSCRRGGIEHGDALRFRLGPKPFYLFSHPDLAEEILVEQSDRFVKVYDPRRPTGLALVLGSRLVTNSGELWKRHRRIIQPVFHRHRMAAMANQMAQMGEQRLAGWAHQALDGRSISRPK